MGLWAYQKWSDRCGRGDPRLAVRYSDDFFSVKLSRFARIFGLDLCCHFSSISIAIEKGFECAVSASLQHTRDGASAAPLITHQTSSMYQLHGLPFYNVLIENH